VPELIPSNQKLLFLSRYIRTSFSSKVLRHTIWIFITFPFKRYWRWPEIKKTENDKFEALLAYVQWLFESDEGVQARPT